MYHYIRSVVNRDDLSYKNIMTFPIELQNILLEDDRVKEYNKDININNDNDNERPIIKNDNNNLNENKEINLRSSNININNIEFDNEIQVHPMIVNVSSTTSSKKMKKKVVKKKKKKKYLSNPDNKVGEAPTEQAQSPESIPNIKFNNNNKKQRNQDLNENVNEIIINNNNCINDKRAIEINRIKGNNTHNKPFSNIKFNSRNAKNSNRNESFKGQFSLQKDQTDRGLLKSNI